VKVELVSGEWRSTEAPRGGDSRAKVSWRGVRFGGAVGRGQPGSNVPVSVCFRHGQLARCRMLAGTFVRLYWIQRPTQNIPFREAEMPQIPAAPLTPMHSFTELLGVMS
jgi:hypothetical protein